MRLLSPKTLLALAVFAAVVVVPFQKPEAERRDFVLEARMASTMGGIAQVYLDDGRGFRETLTSRVPFAAGAEPVQLSFPIPAGTYRALRFDPIASEASVAIADLRVVDDRRRTLREIPPEALQPAAQIAASRVDGPFLRATTTSGANDPQFFIPLEPELHLGPPAWRPILRMLAPRAAVFAGAVLVLLVFQFVPSLQDAVRRTAAQLGRRPVLSVLLVAVAAAVTSAYPVVFLGRSYVSPSFSDGTILLYNQFPTLPGISDATLENAKGSDVGAMAWSHVPISFVLHEAVMEHGEWPLWNRYNSAGTVLLGQGQTMFGHPAHFITVAANGAAWAWDLEYVVARIVFALALGLTVLAFTGYLPGALLTALSAPFVGFFLFRVNHPAFFSFCYAPLILFAWVRTVQARDVRAAVPFAGLLVLASWMEMNSGTAKEAYMLLLSMHLAGFLVLVFADQPWKTKVRRFALLAGAGVVFVLLSAPVWMTFLRALGGSYTSYNSPIAFQIHPSLLLGLFDEIFYRPVHTEERVWNPSANFLVLFAVAYLAATWRRTPGDRNRLALAWAAAPMFALAFGLVPPAWIVKVPFLANVAHIDNTFSCALIILLIVLAGFGLKNAADRLGTPEGTKDLVMAAILVAALVVPWVAITHTVHKEPFGPGTVLPITPWAQPLPVSHFIWIYLLALLGAGATLAWLMRRARRRGWWSPASALLAATCLAVLLWRHGAHGRNTPDDYTYNPAARVDFHAPSPAIERIRSGASAPFRVTGINTVLFPGWSAAYRLEGISGPDALMNPHFRELVDGCGLPRLWDWRIELSPESVAGLRPFTEMLGIRYLLANAVDAARMPAEFERVASEDLAVFASPTAWPRAFFTDRVERCATAAEFAQLVRSHPGKPVAGMAPAEAEGTGLPAGGAGNRVVAATDYRLTSNSTAFTVDAPSRGLVVLQEAWLPGDIRVKVDGRPAPCLRVNHAFRGVMLETAGSHRIEFEFRPAPFYLGLAAAALGLAIGGTALFLLRRTIRRLNPPAAAQQPAS